MSLEQNQSKILIWHPKSGIFLGKYNKWILFDVTAKTVWFTTMDLGSSSLEFLQDCESTQDEKSAEYNTCEEGRPFYLCPPSK